MIVIVVKYTNLFIIKKLSENQPCRERDYKWTTQAEIMALLGALFLIAVKKGNRSNASEFRTEMRQDLWFCDLVSVYIGNQRLQFVKLAPIREFHTQFVKNFQNIYSVGELVTIDEMLVSFRERCSFKQYMPQKPAKFGLKIYALCDARTFYTFNLYIYCGKQKGGSYMTSNKPFDIFKRMTNPIINSNRNLTTENYFSSYELAEYLLDAGLTFLGTLKRNRREVPPEYILNKNRMPGTSITGCQYDKTLVSYVTKKKKIVLLLSTMHESTELDENTQKPVQIVDYNSTKGGVDTGDLMCST